MSLIAWKIMKMKQKVNQSEGMRVISELRNEKMKKTQNSENEKMGKWESKMMRNKRMRKIKNRWILENVEMRK